jgi:hypothetical protein
MIEIDEHGLEYHEGAQLFYILIYYLRPSTRQPIDNYGDVRMYSPRSSDQIQ